MVTLMNGEPFGARAARSVQASLSTHAAGRDYARHRLQNAVCFTESVGNGRRLKSRTTVAGLSHEVGNVLGAFCTSEQLGSGATRKQPGYGTSGGLAEESARVYLLSAFTALKHAAGICRPSILPGQQFRKAVS